MVGGEAYYRRRHPHVEFEKIGLTNQYFNANAKAQEQADLNQVTLLDQTKLSESLVKYPVTMLELERILFTEWSSESSEA